MARPAASASRDSISISGWFGSTNTATMAAFGTSSCSRPSCLPTKSVVVKTTPVTLPPGRLRLATIIEEHHMKQASDAATVSAEKTRQANEIRQKAHEKRNSTPVSQ
jgi:hypothetical protein